LEATVKATITFEPDEKHHPGKPWVLGIHPEGSGPVECVLPTREEAVEMVAWLNEDAKNGDAEIITIVEE